VDRRARWPNCVNARDLGGLPVRGGDSTRPGWLFRSDTLARLAPEGVRAVRAAGVTTVIDLRDEALRQRQPQPFDDGGLQVAAMPLLPDDFPLPVPLDGGYVRALDAAATRVASIVREIAAAPGGVAFHCHSGTGRTGVLAALLLAFATVPGEAIAEDYLLSLEAEAAPWRDTEAARGVMPGLLTHLDAAYGGAEAYLLRAGVDAESLARLRARLLTTRSR
jgi:protein tyrosine/serine phosphatase